MVPESFCSKFLIDFQVVLSDSLETKDHCSWVMSNVSLPVGTCLPKDGQLVGAWSRGGGACEE